METEIKPPVPAEVSQGRGEHTSASNALYDSLCPGRHLAQRGIADTSSPDANFGTQIHEALKKENPDGLTPDQISIYEGCMEIVDRLIKEKFGINATVVTKTRERRFWWRSEDGKYQHSGQVDLLIQHEHQAMIIEYKTLPGDVAAASTNQQLRDQVAMVAGTLKLVEVDAAVVQPLITFNAEVCRYDSESIARSQFDMVMRMVESNNPNSPRVAGAVQCKFCKARFTCNQYHKFMEVSSPAPLSSLAVPVKTWTPNQRALFCERVGMAQKWIDECKAELKKLLKENPDCIPGWKMGVGTIRNPINNPTELHTRFVALGGTTEQFMDCVKITKSDLEGAVRLATGLKGKAFRAKMEELTAGIADSKQSEGSLEEDK